MLVRLSATRKIAPTNVSNRILVIRLRCNNEPVDNHLETLIVVQPESGCLSLADIITIADDVSRVTSRITDNGREVLARVLEQMEEMANDQGRSAVNTYRAARRKLEAEWVTAESVVDDTMNECNRSIHAFVTQADYQIRHFENELQREIRRRPVEECDQQPRTEVAKNTKLGERLDDDE